MKRALRWIGIAFLLVLLAEGGFWAYRRWQGRQIASPDSVPQAAFGAATSPAVSASHAPVLISPAQQHLIGMTTGRAEVRTLEKTIRTVGRVDVDETRVAHVHSKISGWVEEVFADLTFQHVHQGDRLFSIYSPELVSTEEELLLALKARESLAQSPFPNVSAGAESLLEATRRRLSLWDIPPAQIAEIERTGQAQRTLVVYAPLAGHITARNVYPKVYVTPDTELYTIVDHSRVWIYADIYESEIGLVQAGQRAAATTEAYPGQVFQGQLSTIWPHMEHETRTLKVRMDFPNPDLKLKPEMFTNVELKIPLGRRLVVPDTAVVDTGARQLVFVVEGPGRFAPRDVRLGVRMDGVVEVLQGLKTGEGVVTSANFLIDSESQLRAALGGMTLGTGVTEIAGQTSADAGSAAAMQIQFQTEPSPPQTGRNVITATVQDDSGRPVADATVKAIFYMPAMPAMGMSAKRSEAMLQPAGSGVYRGAMEVRSFGTWQVTITVEKGGAMLGSRQMTVNAR